MGQAGEELMAQLKSFYDLMNELSMKTDKNLKNLKIPVKGKKGTSKYMRMKVATHDAPGAGDIKKAVNSSVQSADRKPEKFMKPDGKPGVRMVKVDKEVIKKEASVLKPTKPSDITKHARTLAKNSGDYERNKKKYIDKARAKVFRMYPKESLNGLMKEESIDEATWPDEMPKEEVDVDEALNMQQRMKKSRLMKRLKTKKISNNLMQR